MWNYLVPENCPTSGTKIEYIVVEELKILKSSYDVNSKIEIVLIFSTIYNGFVITWADSNLKNNKVNKLENVYTY